jgi:predicted glycogen debranching enzyme
MELVRRMHWSVDDRQVEPLVTREWLATNGMGGYACGTVSGITSRRYHGLLIAALPEPFGRTMMLCHLSEKVRTPSGSVHYLGAQERAGRLEAPGVQYLQGFGLEMGLPVWRYQIEDFVFEKSLFLAHGQNTVFVMYRLIEGKGTLRFKLLPQVHFRSHDAAVGSPLPMPFRLTSEEDRYELCAGIGLPPLRMKLVGNRGAFTFERQYFPETVYRLEESRGYDYKGTLWSPGYFRVDLSSDHPATFVGSAEEWESIDALDPEGALKAEQERRRRLLLAADRGVVGGMGGELVLAADQFIIRPAGRTAHAAIAHATGDDLRTIIAGYHWFTDWGRDTMISLEGLTLVTGRQVEAGYILRTFGHYVRDGLIPNLFPEGENEGLYHTADATLWFFHALDRYHEATGDRATLQLLLPTLKDILEHHLNGTRFGIHADPADGLLCQGADGYQLTWMDAKVDDWVVTPRRGKAVEINALWYNALRLMEKWTAGFEDEASAAVWDELARRVHESFNRRFWNPERGYLFDVIDGENGDDPACRPNQLFAISLDYPVLDPKHWEEVLQVARERLLTPVGLRSLAPGEPNYKPRYDGDLRARDAAYHQGTVWAWLIGPYIDAWLRTYPERRKEARELLKGFEEHLGEACIGSISEIFDADEPFTPRGCVAQAWSVAEVLRCWLKTSETAGPVAEAAATSVLR